MPVEGEYGISVTRYGSGRRLKEKYWLSNKRNTQQQNKERCDTARNACGELFTARR